LKISQLHVSCYRWGVLNAGGVFLFSGGWLVRLVCVFAAADCGLKMAFGAITGRFAAFLLTTGHTTPCKVFIGFPSFYGGLFYCIPSSNPIIAL
jgi:hypothetical protein